MESAHVVPASWSFWEGKSQAGTAAPEIVSPKWLRCLAESPRMLDAACRRCFGELGVSPSSDMDMDELTCKSLCKQLCLRLSLPDDTFDGTIRRAFWCSRFAPETEREPLLGYEELFALIRTGIMLRSQPLIRTGIMLRSQATPARAQTNSRSNAAPKSSATPLPSILVGTDPVRRVDNERNELRVQVLEEPDSAESAKQESSAYPATVMDEQTVNSCPVWVRIHFLSGSLFSSHYMHASNTVRDVVHALMDKMDDSQTDPASVNDPIMQRGGVMPVLFADDELLYRLDVPIGSLPGVETRSLQDASSIPTIDFRVIWKPLLQVKDRVKVVHSLNVTIMYVPKLLAPGQIGQVQTISGDQKTNKNAHCKLGYALIHFEGVGNCWVSEADQCKLAQISDESEVQDEEAAQAATESFQDAGLPIDG